MILTKNIPCFKRIILSVRSALAALKLSRVLKNLTLMLISGSNSVCGVRSVQVFPYSISRLYENFVFFYLYPLGVDLICILKECLFVCFRLSMCTPSLT